MENNSKLGYSYETENRIQTLDERELIYNLDRPEALNNIPILVVIDGSGCSGQKRPSIRELFRPGPDRPAQYARITVEKPGVDPFADNPDECSESFLKNYTMDKRLEDHLRVLHHVRNTSTWWNGDLLIWGWSDGGDIGSRLLAYYPNTKKAILGSFGGGLTMQEMFEAYWFCNSENLASDTQEERQKCRDDLNQKVQKIADNPTWNKSWLGNDNSWRVWASRLFVRNQILLKNNKVPVLIIHGVDDKEPLTSSRRMVKTLKVAENTAFTAWEVKGMGHSFGKMSKDRYRAFEQAQLNWFFDKPVGIGGPPDFAFELESKIN